MQKLDTSEALVVMWGWGVQDGSNVFQTCNSGCQAGISGSNNGQFNFPSGIDVDETGDVFVAERFGRRVQRFSSAPAYEAEWGTPGTLDGEFADLSFLTLDGNGDVYVADKLNHRVQKFDRDGGHLTTWGSNGTGNSQFNQTWGIAVRDNGEIYVADRGNNRIQKFQGVSSLVNPKILSIVDVANDQGRRVRITWQQSSEDSAGSAAPITEYGIYRRIDPLLVGAPLQQQSRLFPMVYPPGDWDFVTMVPARGEMGYNTVVETLCDSTIASGQCYSVFFVSARTASPTVFYDSKPDSGYSVDNLPPGAPQSLVFLPPGSLSWDPASETDLSYYTVYGSSSATFDGSAVSLYTTIETSQNLRSDWMAGGIPPYPWYFVTVTDHSGNEGDAAAALNTVAVPGPGVTPTRFALGQSRPNPFRFYTRVFFDLPQQEFVRLRVFDVEGRLVRTLLEEEMPEGAYSLPWLGKDADGHAVPSGIYFYRIDAGSFSEVKKMILVR